MWSGLCSPPAHAVVLCVVEKSRIQALDPSQPMLTMRPASWRRSYAQRHAMTLIAGLDIAPSGSR